MPSILNINNRQNTNDRKLSSKLSFDVGEKFSGKIVNVDEKAKEVTVRLSDGWQFTAEISDDISKLSDLVAKFQVDGFQDGKLKLKLVNNDTAGRNQGDVLQDFLKSEGLSKDDVDILKEMMNHGMQISKEDIVKLKGILNFKEDLAENPDVGDKFIQKYMVSKQIDANSNEGMEVKNTLSDFFDEFKSMTNEEVFLFLECDIDLNTENIKAFKDLTSKDGQLFKTISEFKDQLIEINPKDIDMDAELGNNVKVNKEAENNIKSNENVVKNSDIENSNKDNGINLTSDRNIKAKALADLYNSNKETKVNMMSLLKALTTNDTDIVKYVISDTLLNDKSLGQQSNDNDKIQNKLANMSDKEIVLKLKEQGTEVGEKVENLSKRDLQKALSNVFESDIKLNAKQTEKIQNAIKYLVDSNILEDNSSTNNSEENVNSKGNANNKEENINNKSNNKENINNNSNVNSKEENINDKDNINNKSENISSNSNIDNKEESKNNKNNINNKEQSVNNNKDTIDENKNSQSGVKSDNINNKEIPNDKVNKQESNTNKEDVQNQNNKANANLVKEDPTDKKVNFEKSIINENKFTSQEIVKEVIKDKAEEIKSILKDMIKTIKPDNGDLTNKVFEMLKDKITEFKVFNSLSSEYYYMDIPVSLNQNEYPCKLIIKDNRKDGKRIDSTNLKLVVSVKTVSIGVVDAYIKVRNKNLDIDMKCDEEFAKVLSLGREKLKKDLKTLGYGAGITISKKIKEASITNCSQFFNDTTIAVLDKRV